MKAVIIEEFGDAEVLKQVETTRPSIGGDQILVKVLAVGINPVDAKIRAGKHVSCSSLELPAVLGKDMSGIIESVGKHVSSFKIGDEVFGCVDKAYSEYTAVRFDTIALKPGNVSFEAAAGVSLAGLTAHQAIHEQLKLLPGEHVLIHAAAGGVGHLAVQFAKLAGCYVSGTASARNLKFLTSLGVDSPIDYKLKKFEELIEPDAVIDGIGGEVLYRSISCVKPGGRIVCLPSSTKDDPKAIALAKERGVTLIWFMMKPKLATLLLIADLMKANKLRVNIHKAFQMDEMIEAHKAIESQSTRGKIVVHISS